MDPDNPLDFFDVLDLADDGVPPNLNGGEHVQLDQNPLALEEEDNDDAFPEIFAPPEGHMNHHHHPPMLNLNLGGLGQIAGGNIQQHHHPPNVPVALHLFPHLHNNNNNLGHIINHHHHYNQHHHHQHFHAGFAAPPNAAIAAMNHPPVAAAAVASPAACELKWLPESLFNSAVSSITARFNNLKWPIRLCLPGELQFAVFWKLYKEGRLCQVGYEFCDLTLFSTLLQVRERRYELHQMVQGVFDHGLRLGETLVTSYCQLCSSALADKRRNMSEFEENINLGFMLGSFLSEAGWYIPAEQCFRSCLSLCEEIRKNPAAPVRAQFRCLECMYRLLDAYNGYCKYSEGYQIYTKARKLAEELQALLKDETVLDREPQLRRYGLNVAELYNQFSILFFSTGGYKKAMDWAVSSLKEIGPDCPVKTVVDSMRQACKVLTVQRQFKQADLLIKHAVSLAKFYFDGAKRFPGVLLDFGFYLMNTDLSDSAAKVYQMALDYRLAQYGGNNLRVAQAHEDLAYAMYVQEYSSGHFREAREHGDKAIEILKTILPDNHLMLSSSRRVKALILEEIAIDSQDKQQEAMLLQEAEDLHMSALGLCKRMFGEDNIQTAKHYGNLGRLYQSMHRFPEAEKMHERAIGIKQRLLGEEDYEVALSIGHLASLYNYDMGRYEEAESLYLRSVDIGKGLFGEAYSGLEYDYRGLVHCYGALKEPEKLQHFVTELHRWKLLRDNQMADQSPQTLWQSLKEPRDTQLVIKEFFKKYN